MIPTIIKGTVIIIWLLGCIGFAMFLMDIHDYLKKATNTEGWRVNMECRMTGVEEQVRTTIPYVRMVSEAAKESLDEIRDNKKKTRQQLLEKK